MKELQPTGPRSDGPSSRTAYNPQAVLRINSFATILAWAFASLAFLTTLFGGYTIYTLFASHRYVPNFLDLAPGILFFLFLILLCLFFAAQLFVSAERLFLLTDIEENTSVDREAIGEPGKVIERKGEVG
jgi:hypothetical protein